MGEPASTPARYCTSGSSHGSSISASTNKGYLDYLGTHTPHHTAPHHLLPSTRRCRDGGNVMAQISPEN